MRNVIAIVWLLVIGIVDVSCAPRRVLIIARGGGVSQDLFIEKEIGFMTNILDMEDFKYDIASVSKSPIVGKDFSLHIDMDLSKIKAASYSGILIPCLGSEEIPQEAIRVVKEAVVQQKPIAASHSAVSVLSEAGALVNKKFAAPAPSAASYHTGEVAGNGVIQDGSIITAGGCIGSTEEKTMAPDGTAELMRVFIKSLNVKK